MDFRKYNGCAALALAAVLSAEGAQAQNFGDGSGDMTVEQFHQAHDEAAIGDDGCP